MTIVYRHSNGSSTFPKTPRPHRPGRFAYPHRSPPRASLSGHTRGNNVALADRIAQPAPERVHGLPCSVGKLLAELPEAEADALRHMLSNGWSQRQVFDA